MASWGNAQIFERGGDVRLGSFLSVLRALGSLDNAQALVAAPVVRPSQVAAEGTARKRASSRRGPSATNASWTWGDEL